MKKYIIGFILGAIIFSTISVYATIYYEASQINYKNTTLDHAIDDLYTTQNTTVSNLNSTIDTLQSSLNTYTSPLTIELRADAWSTTNAGQGLINIANFKTKYKYIRVNSFGALSGLAAKTCKMYIVNNSTGTEEVTVNQQYETSSHNYLFLVAWSSTNGSQKACTSSITFYN